MTNAEAIAQITFAAQVVTVCAIANIASWIALVICAYRVRRAAEALRSSTEHKP